MKLFKQDLLTLLISLFIFTGCENPDGIGLDVDPDNAIEGKLVDSLTVLSSTVKEDTLSTKSLSKYPFGYFKDPIFGTTDAQLAVSLTLPSTAVQFGRFAVLDSAVLVLKYSDEFTGDPNSRLMVEVSQLLQQLTDEERQYFNNVEHPINLLQGTIGSKSIKVNLKDSVSIMQPVKGGPDVFVKKAPHARIPLNAAFVQEQFLNADSTKFNSNSVFNDFIKGLQLRVNKDQTTGAGGLVTFDLADSVSRFELYYRKPNGTATDTILTTFKINNSLAAATFKHDYTGTPVATQLSAPGTTYSVNFIQPMAGVKTRVTFPYVKNLKALGDITINKAELVVEIEGGSDIFSPAPRLYLYRTDIAEQRQLIPDVTLGLSDLSLGGFYDSTKKQYRFALTAYIQDLVNGRLTQYNTYITAVDSKANPDAARFPSGSTVSRSVVQSGPGKMKLNIIYTQVKK